MPRAVLVSGQSKYGIECLFIQVQLPTSKEASSHDVYFFCLVFRLISPSLTTEWALVICKYETSYDVQIPLVNCRMSHQAPECAIACTVLQSAEVQYYALGYLPVPRFAGSSRVD
jgi:hypothetical protein